MNTIKKLIRLSPTGIEYGDYAWNFVSGCGNNIDGKCKDGGFKCWAYSISQRFEGHYPNGFKPTIYPEALCSPLYLKKPSRILCAFMGDMFGDWFNPDEKIEGMMPSGRASITMSLKGWIYTTIKQCPQHTFLFLTKQPKNLLPFSPFPENCWVGVTVTNNTSFHLAIKHLQQVEAKVKYLSIEPFLEEIYTSGIIGYETIEKITKTVHKFLDWVIIGACTGTMVEIAWLCGKYSDLTPMPYGSKWTAQPKIEWVEEIVQACDKAGISVFLKENLRPLFAEANNVHPNMVGLRQEMPVKKESKCSSSIQLGGKNAQDNVP